MSVIKITKENFEQEVMQAKEPVLIDFWAAWCGPCKMMSPVIDQLAEDHPEIKVAKINIDEEMELAQKYGVMSIPTVVLFKEGQAVDASVGYVLKKPSKKCCKQWNHFASWRC